MTLVYPIALEATGDVDPLTDLSEGIRPEFLHGAALAAKAFHKCWGPPPAAVAALGLRCPDDVSLIAVDEPPWSEMATPRLSAIRPPAAEVAEPVAAIASLRLGWRGLCALIDFHCD